MWTRFLEISGLIGFSSLIASSFFHLFNGNGWSALAYTCFALPIAIYLADLFTGCVHWACDSFGSEATPVWGPLLIAAFRQHHRDPLAITRIPVVENIGGSALASFCILLLWHPIAGDENWFWHLWLWFMVFNVLSNLCHRWAHLPLSQKPGWMIALQNLRLMLPPDQHLHHHRPPYRVNYCVLVGWGNGLSNRIPWSRLESWLARRGLRTNFD